MNNRFRFRVFDKEKNNYVDDSEVELILHNDGVLLFGNWHEDIKVVEQDKFIVEQCTGLRDNIGHLIYEGDILRTYDEDWVIVEWVDCGFKALIDDTYYDLDDIVDKYTQVISNLHEQAEQKEIK